MGFAWIQTESAAESISILDKSSSPQHSERMINTIIYAWLIRGFFAQTCGTPNHWRPKKQTWMFWDASIFANIQKYPKMGSTFYSHFGSTPFVVYWTFETQQLKVTTLLTEFTGFKPGCQLQKSKAKHPWSKSAKKYEGIWPPQVDWNPQLRGLFKEMLESLRF